ncbi:hypothetical protein L2E82_05757 [Cichorium intybus]|uniref:Uncharacterized protein n=1 Tax=Cichorium intybus TaxID=13427 RepID=A0ACB9HAC6_CICIN|nr:hypothetical protein L2E82_05757 [Cichorium intybus]
MMFQSLLLIFEYTLSVVIIDRAIRKYYDRSTKTEESKVEEAEKEGEALIPPTVSSSNLHGRPLQEAVVINHKRTKDLNSDCVCDQVDN